jgi:hypothetical protein
VDSWIYHLKELRQVVDFGLLVLIWLVQLLIYPSFKQIRPESFHQWHTCHMNRMGFIAGALILSQTTLVGLQIWLTPSKLIWYTAALVFLMWALTGLLSVPLHNRLHHNGHDREAIESLIFTNWFRTAGWTAIFLLGLFA